MNERLILQGALQEKKMERMKLAIRAEALISGLRTKVLPASVTPLAELQTAQIRELAIELDGIRVEYMQLTREIDSIRKELG